LNSEFPANLQRYVTDVRAAGGIPVLVTPLARREFKDGKQQNTLEPWAAAARRVAQEMTVPIADLNADSVTLIQKMGPVEATTLAMTAPLISELAAARTGTTLPPRPASEARVPDIAARPDGPRGRIVRKFDYTHLGDAGAEEFAQVIANELAVAIPELRDQLLP